MAETQWPFEISKVKSNEIKPKGKKKQLNSQEKKNRKRKSKGRSENVEQGNALSTLARFYSRSQLAVVWAASGARGSVSIETVAKDGPVINFDWPVKSSARLVELKFEIK